MTRNSKNSKCYICTSILKMTWFCLEMQGCDHNSRGTLATFANVQIEALKFTTNGCAQPRVPLQPMFFDFVSPTEPLQPMDPTYCSKPYCNICCPKCPCQFGTLRCSHRHVAQSPQMLVSPLRNVSPRVGASVPAVDSVPFPSGLVGAPETNKDLVGIGKSPGKGCQVGSPPTAPSALHVLEWATPG